MKALPAVLSNLLLLMPLAGALGNSPPAPVWIDAREVSGFRVFCRFPADRIAPLLGDLDGLSKDIAAYLGLEASPRAVDVYLFADAREYAEYVKRAFPEVPYRRALYVQRGDRAMVAAYLSPELATDLRHECTHALLHSALPMVPLWLDEGLAEYFEVEPLRRAGGSPYLAAVRWRSRLGYVPSLEGLEGLRSMASMTEADYRNAWSWVHFMLHGPPEARDALVDYLSVIRQGGIPGSLGGRLSARIPRLKTAYKRHFSSWGR
ncbi:MAG: hypothetical protein GYA33_16210 [Thermogutta sp.]|nr:hypothetical protein [Thermogutta sp.]